MKRIGIIFGGANSEHEVSCHSAESVVEHLDRTLFEPVLLGIDRDGGWHRVDAIGDLDGGWHRVDAIGDLDGAGTGTRLPDLDGIDVAFPVLHGRFGEDGTIQGLLEMAGLDYVGCGVLSSSLAMDKRLTQRLLEASGIPTIPTRTVTAANAGDAMLIAKPLGFPLFVKPNRAGSSVGASPVAVESELTDAVALALDEDAIALIQSSITGDEVAMAVLQRADGTVAVGPPLRVVTADSTRFFDYAAKYTEGGGATLEVPAQIPQQVIEMLEAFALTAFETLDCDGLARVDFFVQADGEIMLNEVNTMPGFTALSQYPRMWQAAGLSYTDLITALIERAEVARS